MEPKKQITILIIGLLVALNLVAGMAGRWRYRGLVIHHTASDRGDYASIRRQHRRWGDVAYHLVMANGSGSLPAGYLEAGSRYRLMLISPATRARVCNFRDLHLVVVGNYEQGPLPPQLKAALVEAVVEIRRRWRIPEDQVRLHRDCSATLCPGRHLTLEAMSGRPDPGAVPAGVRQQQRRVIAGPFVGPFLAGPLVLTLPFSLVLIVVWSRVQRRLFRRLPPV